MSRSPTLVAIAVLALNACSAGILTAAGGVDRIANEEQTLPAAYSKRQGWPQGALALANDSQRTIGWRYWFTGIHHHPDNFALAPRTAADVQRIVDQFATIEGLPLYVRLSAAAEPKAVADLNARRGGAVAEQLRAQRIKRSTAVVFSIGSEKARQAFRKTKAPPQSPAAMSVYPTLTIYTGKAFIDPDQLQLPKRATVRRID